MGCNCGGAKKTYVVTLPNGTIVEVNSEREARTEITKAGGGNLTVKAAK